MTILILVAVFLAVVLLAVGVAVLLGRRDPAVRRRVLELEAQAVGGGPAPLRLTRGPEVTPLRKVVTRIGETVPASAESAGNVRRRLMQAGFRDDGASLLYMGIRVLLAVALPIALLLTIVPGMETRRAMMVLVASAALGYMLPVFVLGRIVKRRQQRITDALPDALDLLVVCVEAGLGLNQAIMRVGGEMAGVEPVIAEEFNLVNLEMRAGKSRTDALKNLARRTGVDDLSSLVSMLVQTDRFGTSVATSLRVFSDGMRIKRRQKAEEAAAKTTIKMIFPLATCILPSLFVVVIGPAGLHIFENLVKR